MARARGLAVGSIEYFGPRTLGMGYENISAVLSGHASLGLLLALCFLKFASWAISLGSSTSAPISTLLQPRTATVLATDSLRTAVERMARDNVDVLPVVSAGSLPQVKGISSYRDILAAYKHRLEDDGRRAPHIRLKRQRMRVLLRGQALFQKQSSEAE